FRCTQCDKCLRAMSKEQIRIDRHHYFNRKGRVENHKTISEISRRHGKVFLDRRNARYLVEENIRDDVEFDLKIGCCEYFADSETDEEEEEHEEENEEEENETILNGDTFCKWACLQPQRSLKEVFGGADFFCWRTVVRDIAETVVFHNPKKKGRRWSRIALRAGDVIMLGIDDSGFFLSDSEESENELDDEGGGEENNEEMKREERVEEDEKEERKRERMEDIKVLTERQRYYSGYKFEQYMTSKKPQGKSEPEKPLEKRNFQTVMTLDLTEDYYEPIKICSFAEVDALRGDEPIEIKSTYAEGFASKLHTFLHCNFANMKSLITGIRDEDFVVRRVFERRTCELQRQLANKMPGESRADEKSYSFLHDVLSMTRQVLTRAEACRFSYLPRSGIIQFEPISLSEAEKRGHGFVFLYSITRK
ncbi:hypothetical protein PFISCL1PPCAC_24994, partial [Pristionchus fissidentatus]